MRWFITGASGFVGRAVATRLIEQSQEVTVHVRHASQVTDLAPHVRVHEGSLGDPNTLRDAARDTDIVVHAAAVSDPRASSVALRWVNVAGSENVLRAAAAAGVKRMIHVSCADVTLGNVDRVNWDETRSLGAEPLTEHARTKQLAEELVLAESGPAIEVIAIRPPIVWGPGDTRLPDLLNEALTQNGLRLVGNGGNLISVVYIDHLVDAILVSATKGTAGRSYYVTDNEFLESEEFYRELSVAAGVPKPRRGYPYPIEYALAGWRERLGRTGLSRTEVIHRGRPAFFNVQDAITDLGFEPRVDLAEGMKRLRQWIESEGGANRVAARRRPIPDANSVADMIAAADEWSDRAPSD